MKGKVIILNGPPGSGKDVIAKYMSESNGGIDVFHREVKKTLFKQALAISGINEEDWFLRYEDRELKNKPWDKLGGLSQRQFLIKISEEWVKPVFGKDFYGEVAGKLAKDYVNHKCTVVFSDGGFQEEFDTIKKIVGEENILLVRLYRGECTFEGDSRSYLSNPNFEMELINDSTLEEAAKRIKQRLEIGYQKV